MGWTIRVIGFFVLFTLLACAKKQETATVTLALPDWSSAATHPKSGSGPQTLAAHENISVIIVNINGAGMNAPAVWKWDNHDSGAPATPPTSISLTVPRGPNRLIQVLVVFESAGAMEFHYGDALTAITSDGQGVSVAVNSIGGVNAQGSVSGRYLRADGVGPTGPVEIRFAPPNGRAPMVIETEYMYAGWFRFFALPTAGFTYRFIPTGESLFENFSTTNVTPTGAQQAKIYIPPYWYHDQWSAGTPVGPRKPNLAQTSIVGFFGPGATGKSVCFSNTPATLNDSYASASAADNSKLRWVGNAALGATDAGVQAGGTTSCGAAVDEFITYAKLDETQVTRQEGLLGFRGPFALQPNGGHGYKQEILGVASDLNVVLNWKYVPGVTAPGGVRGTRVFYRFGQSSLSDNDADYGRSGEIKCDELAQLSRPFAFLKDESASAGATSVSTTIPATAANIAEFNAGKFQAVVCPYVTDANGRVQLIPRAGVDFRSYGTGPAVPTAIRLAVVPGAGPFAETTPAARAQVPANTCYPLRVSAMDAAGNPSLPLNNWSLTIKAHVPEGGDENLHSDPSCGSGGDQVSFYGLNNDNAAYVYLKTPASSGAFDVTVQQEFATWLLPATFHASVAASTSATKLTMDAPSALKKFFCYPYTLSSRDDSSRIAHLSTSAVFDYREGFEFFPLSNDCGGGTSSSMAFGPSTAFSWGSFRYVGPGGGALNSSPTTSDSAASGITIVPKPINVEIPEPPARVDLADLPPAVSAEGCYPVSVVLRGASNAEAVILPNDIMNDDLIVQVQASNALLYTSPGCSYSGSSSMSVLIGPYKSRGMMGIYVAPEATGAVTLTITPTNLTGTGANPIATTVSRTAGPAVAGRIRIGLEPQIWQEGVGFVGTHYSRLEGEPLNLHLRASTRLSSLTDTTSFLPPDLSSIGFRVSPASYVVQSDSLWSAGARTLTLTGVTGDMYSGGWNVETGVMSTLLDSQWAGSTIFSLTGVSLSGPPSLVAAGSCQPLLVQLTDSRSPLSAPVIPATSLVTVTLTASGSPSSLYFYGSDQTCAVTGSHGSHVVNFNPGESTKLVFVKAAAAATETITAFSSGLSAMNNVTLAADSSSSGPESHLRFLGRPQFQRNICHGFAVFRSDSSGNALPLPTSRGLTLSDAGFAAGSIVTYYSDPKCQVGLGTGANLSLSQSAAVIYVKVLGLETTDSSGRLLITDSASILTSEMTTMPIGSY